MISIAKLYDYYCRHPQVVTDSRQIKEGAMFFALKGERFDGNQYALEALRQGAAFAVIDDPTYNTEDRCLLVENVLSTLQQLATYHRQQFEVPVLAITGSNGKTTTKELVNQVLKSQYKTHATLGNLNNHIGVPLTLLAMPIDIEIAVVEMGANHIGEIAALCEIARPSHGLITNVGKAHLEGFGSFEGVQQAKAELYVFLTAQQGVAFINADEPYLSELAKGLSHRLHYRRNDQLSAAPQPYEVELLSVSPFVSVAFYDKEERYVCESQLIGAYNFNNIITAIAIGQYFKVPAARIQLAIETYVPQNNRSQLIEKDGNTFILDAYNANPTSMHQALTHLANLEASHKIAILGDMLELGAYSDAEHLSLIDYASQLGFEKLICVGAAFGRVLEENKALHFENVTELKAWFEQENLSGRHILLKGSRGIRMETLLS